MAGQVGHVTDSIFQTEVLESQLPVLVDFWATWCVPCLNIAPHLEAIAAQQAGKLKIVKLDVDENPVMATQYQIRSIPSLILFHQGQIVSQRIGSASKAALETFIQEGLQKIG